MKVIPVLDVRPSDFNTEIPWKFDGISKKAIAVAKTIVKGHKKEGRSFVCSFDLIDYEGWCEHKVCQKNENKYLMELINMGLLNCHYQFYNVHNEFINFFSSVIDQKIILNKKDSQLQNPRNLRNLPDLSDSREL